MATQLQRRKGRAVKVTVRGKGEEAKSPKERASKKSVGEEVGPQDRETKSSGYTGREDRTRVMFKKPPSRTLDGKAVRVEDPPDDGADEEES